MTRGEGLMRASLRRPETARDIRPCLTKAIPKWRRFGLAVAA
jgi:hypothetical protein